MIEFKDNPCEEHLNVRTGAFCPICLMAECDSLRNAAQAVIERPMTLTEARKVAEVLAEVDGGCSHCAEAAAKDMADKIPEFPWVELVEKAGKWNFAGWDDA